MDKEKLINQIMKECEADGEPVTREEAAEMADMELKAKKDCRRYEGDTKARKSATREKKVDDEKVAIIARVALYLKAENVTIANEQREITFTVGENEYSLTLTKHRKKKN